MNKAQFRGGEAHVKQLIPGSEAEGDTKNNNEEKIKNKSPWLKKTSRGLFCVEKGRMYVKTIKYIDMFSGMGGFREGLTRAGGFTCAGHCEIDKYANRSYNTLFQTEGEWFCEDARTIDPEEMPEFDLLCGGFPCQSF